MSRFNAARFNRNPQPKQHDPRFLRIVNVLVPVGDTLVLLRLELKPNDTTMSRLREMGYEFSSYDDIEIEFVGRITY